MVKTYIVEQKTDIGHDILEYFRALKEAKSLLVDYKNCGNNKGKSILCLSGNYFGEGYHQYRTIIVTSKNGNKFIKIKDNLDQY